MAGTESRWNPIIQNIYPENLGWEINKILCIKKYSPRFIIVSFPGELKTGQNTMSQIIFLQLQMCMGDFKTVEIACKRKRAKNYNGQK